MYVLSHGSIKVKTGSFQQATFDDTGVYQHVSTVLAGISHWISIFDVFFSQLVKNGKLLANGDPIPSRRGCWKVPWQRDARGCWWICSWKKHRPVFILQLFFDPESSKRNEGVTPQICRCITCFSHMYQCATIFGTGEMQVATPMAPHIGTLKKKRKADQRVVTSGKS